MKRHELGLCFFPTTIGLIDDDKQYMKQLFSRLVGKEQLSCLTYDKPENALNFFIQQYKSDSFINHCLISQETDAFDQLITELNISIIHQEIFNSKRYNEVSTLVVDFAMPRINGLDLARTMRKSNPYIKIIMLTGEAGHSLAVEAFNERSIDHFILKTEPNALEVLVQAIHTAQTEYFLDLSAIVLNKVADFSKKILLCLSDSVWVEFFKEFCKIHNIVEYYLMNEHGGFLLLDVTGKPSILAVADEEMMKSYRQLAYFDNASQSIIDALENKQKLPFFYSENDFSTRPAEWGSYLHPAKVLQGKETYCYAYITDPRKYAIDQDKITSYQQFLKSIQR